MLRLLILKTKAQASRRATYGALTLALLAFSAIGAATTAQARARSTRAVADAAQAAGGSCVIHSLPSFVAQGEFALEGTVADVIEVECNPFVYGTGASVTLTAAQLYSRCEDNISWYNPNEDGYLREETHTDKFTVHLDVDGNANVALIAGPHCMPGESLITLDENEAPYETFTTAFQVLPDVNTPQGLHAMPAAQVEDAESSAVATIVEAEFPGASEAKVRLGAEQLYDRCRMGEHLLWVRENREVIAGPELAGEHAVELDDNGNGFAIAIGDDSCAEGTSLIEGDLEERPFTTETTEFTILPPQPTFEEPSFTIEKLQEIRGSGKGFTKEALVGKLGQTVDYEMVVKNTGNVALTLFDFTDAHCDPGTIAGGPGSSPLEPGESTTYTCDHVLNTYGSYTNEATVSGTPPSGVTITHTSNQVVVTVLEPGFKIEKLQEIRGSGMGFTKEKLIGAIGETVDYEIVVTNTGHVPLTFSGFTDAHCDPGTIEGGPGSSPVVPGASTTYTCSHVLTEAGIYMNVAEVTGTPEGETPIKHESNRVEVEVPTTPPVEEPAFTIEKLQRIGGSGSFTKEKLTGMVGETVEYEIIVKNTGNVSLTFSAFTDTDCESISGGPGATPVAPGESTTFTCIHVLTKTGTYTNVAKITGTPKGKMPIEEGSNVVEVEANTTPPEEKPAFTLEKLQRIGMSSSFTKEPLTGSIGETVEYEIIIRNTGNVPLTFSSFEDSLCDAGTIEGGPGSNPVGVGEATAYRCSHVLTSASEYINVAFVTGTTEGGTPVERQESNRVIVTVPEEPKKEEKPASNNATPAPTTPTTTTSSPTNAKHGVAPVCVASAAKLKGVTGPKSGSFTVQVPSKGIKQITFYIDGRKLKTLKQSQAKNGKFTIKINTSKLSYGPHKVSIKAVTTNSDCAPLARSSQFVHTASSRKAPKFTG